MKKLGFYAAVVIALVFTLWFATKDGMRPSEGAAPPDGSVGCVMLESLSMGRRVSVEDPEDIERLGGTLSTLSEENGVMVDLEEDFPESMRDWTIEWLSPQGERLALVEINRVGTVFRGDQCFNFLGGEIFDMDYLRGLLLGLPDVGEQLFDVESVGWAILRRGKDLVVRNEGLEELCGILSGMSFHKGEKAQDTIGCGDDMKFFGRDGREIGSLKLLGDKKVKFDGYYYEVEGGSGPLKEWLEHAGMTMPEAEYGDRFPIVDFKHDRDAAWFSISAILPGTAETKAVVRITDPELVELLEAQIDGMEFRADGPAPLGKGNCVYRIDSDFHREIPPIQVVDGETIWYSGWLYKVMDGKRLDMELFRELMDPEGMYKGRPGVDHWKKGDEPLPELTPEPGTEPSPEPTPAGTAVPYVMENPPKERIFDLDGGYVVMFNNNGGGTVDIKGEEFASLVEELSGLRFELREQCSIDSISMHALEEDIERYHGNPLFTLTWFDGDGNEGAEFTARSMEGWIDCEGWYYQAKEGGIDIESLKELMRAKDRHP